MARPLKVERNKQLVELRESDPSKYSYAKLGDIFRISRITAREIYIRESARSKRPARVIHTS